MPADSMVSYGTRDAIDVSPEEWAARLAAHCRITRPEYRQQLLHVTVWRNRGDSEHYRTPPPPPPLSTVAAFTAGVPDWQTHLCADCDIEDES
jgi:hypothetical protein